MLNFLELQNTRMLSGALLMSMMLMGCQPDPADSNAEQKTTDGASETVNINDNEEALAEENTPEPIDAEEAKVSTGADKEISSDKAEAESNEGATKTKEQDVAKGVDIWIENDRAKPEELFDYANSEKYAEGYREVVSPKSGSHPTLFGYPIVYYSMAYVDEWVGCCPSPTNRVLFADTSAGNSQQLEAYAKDNECEIWDVDPESVLNDLEENSELPIADAYKELTCPNREALGEL